jgi:hypothetical protein
MESPHHCIRAAYVHAEMLQMERGVTEVPTSVRPLFGGDSPTLRDSLFRAGAAWVISWAILLAAIEWLPRAAG